MKRYFLRRAVSRGARRTVSFSTRKSAAALSRSKSGLKLGQKRSATRRRRPAKGFTWSCVNIPPGVCKCVTAMMTFLLFIGAIVMVVLYFHKQKRPGMEGNSAMMAIREVMIFHNESFRGKTDLEILDGAQKLAWDLSQQQSRNDEIEKATMDIFRKVQRDWVPSSGNLYFFSDTKLQFYGAQKTCREIGGSNLVDITSQNEEKYLERERYLRNETYYIGLTKERNRWQWVTGEPLTTSYWAPREEGQREGSCAALSKCQQSAKCWQKISCARFEYWICKLKPNPKFF